MNEIPGGLRRNRDFDKLRFLLQKTGPAQQSTIPTSLFALTNRTWGTPTAQQRPPGLGQVEGAQHHPGKHRCAQRKTHISQVSEKPVLRVTFLFELQSQAFLSPAKLHISVILSLFFFFLSKNNYASYSHFTLSRGSKCEVKNVHYCCSLRWLEQGDYKRRGNEVFLQVHSFFLRKHLRIEPDWLG